MITQSGVPKGIRACCRREEGSDVPALFAGSVRKSVLNDGVFLLEIRAAS
jgi:hypothetical protein